MRRSTLYLGAFALAFLVVAVAVLGLIGLRSFGVDPASLRELAAAVERERLRRQVLLEQGRSSHARLLAKAKLHRDLAEGRIPLLNAAALSRDLAVTAGDDFHWEEFRRQFPDAESDDERFCRQEIEGAENLLRWEQRAEEADRLAEKLKAELRQRKQDGTLRLRESGPPGGARDE
jgi:hypothetical protein